MLEIINVSFGDQGFYVCVARTPVDQDVAVAQLSVVGKLCAFGLHGLGKLRWTEVLRAEIGSPHDTGRIRIPAAARQELYP